MTDQIVIDGSVGEGGGQIVRTSLALSLITGQPVKIENVRAGRKKPGLMRQHLTAFNAAAQIGNAEVSGAEIGSCSLTFAPQQIVPGNYHFSIGTAGSATLVLQTILPALIIAESPSTIILEGGTHNQWAPPFDFLQLAFLPLINQMGPKVTATLERPGFYPAGGGRMVIEIEPTPQLKGFDLLERGELRQRSATALVSNLPLRIAEREVDTILQKMNWSSACGSSREVKSPGPGNIAFAALEYENVTEVFTGFGRVGVAAEQIAKEVVREVRNYLKSAAPVGPHLADQIMLPLGISAWQQGSQNHVGSFRTIPLTRHSTTHIDLLRKILGIEITVTNEHETETTLVSF